MKKLMHCIWIGDETKRPDDYIKTWKDKHPSWKYKLWGNKEIYGRKWKNQKVIDHYTKLGKYPGVADTVRYEILYEQGGFMHPADSVCLHSIDELFDKKHTAYAVYENEKVRPGLISPLYGCKRGDKLAKDLIEALSKIKTYKTPWQTTGNCLMRQVIKSGNYPKLKIFPSYTFTPIHYTGETYNGREKVYAVQKWGTTTEGKMGIGKYEYPLKDIVYLLDTRKESKILPLSIRTAKQTLNYRKIFIVGKKPKKVEAEEIYIEDVESKPIENICKKLKAVIDDDRVSNDFILMNDDFIILQKYDIIKYYHQGKIKDYKPNSYWTERVKVLKKRFPDGKIFNLHFPIVYNKAKLREVLEKIDIEGGIRTYYCNYHNIEGEYHEDHKIYQKAKIKDHADAPFLSTSQVVENTRLGEIEKIIKKRGL